MTAKKKTTPAKKPAVTKTKAKVLKKASSSTVLSPKDQRVVEEWLKYPNQTAAYLKVHPDCSPVTARTLAARVFAKVGVRDYLAELREKQRNAAVVSSAKAINEAWAIATADTRELMEHRVGCCRYCWGNGHLYQRTDGEFMRDKEEHAAQLRAAKSAKGRAKIGTFNPQGGAGYKKALEPHPDCPDCAGEGIGRMVFKDVRNVSDAAVSLFAGIKESKEGREIKLHSKSEALDKVFRHLGLFNDKLAIVPHVTIKDFTGKKGPAE